MDVMTAIKTRRTYHDWRPEPLAKEVLGELIEAATWAPNHKLTEPWEFYVATGETKEQLARLRGELKAGKFQETDPERAQKSYQKAYEEMHRTGAVILVAQQLAAEPERQEEDTLACACAMQNLLLAATARGLGTFWGTGPLIRDPRAHELLGVPAGRKVLGLIFVGHPAVEAPPVRRTAWQEKTFFRD